MMCVCLVCVNCRAQGGQIREMVDGSATVPIATGVAFIAAAVVILSGEMVIEIAIEIHGATSATRQVCKGQGLCHGEVGWFHCFVVHGSIVQGQQWRMGQMVSTLSGVTLIHLIGLPEVRRQIVAGSSIARAIRYAPLMVGV
jgi:hypothetical protein